MCHLSHYNARQLIQQAETLHANLIVHNICHVAWRVIYIGTTYALKGGAAHAAVIMQSPQVRTTKSAQPRSHGKQGNTKLYSHDTPTICPSIHEI